MIDFKFLTARELSKVLNVLNQLDNVKVIAGGTDLIVDIRKQSKRLPEIDYLLDISGIEELKHIKATDGYLEIGALVTHNMLINDPEVKSNFPVLVEAAKSIGSNQIRNRGTIGGNICNGAACADMIPPLIALNAEVEVRSFNATRIIPVENFVTGPYKNLLEKNEIVCSIRVPLKTGRYYSYYYKVGRRKALNISRLSVVFLTKVENGVFKDVNFVTGAATPYPMVFYKTQNAICCKLVNSIDLHEVGRTACEEMLSITGERWSSEYKKTVIFALARRALESVIREVNSDGQNQG